MAHGEDAYDVLGVSPASDEAEIKRAFRAAARRYHPDTGPEGADPARFLAARRAYEELMDRDARARLDRCREADRARGQSPSGVLDGLAELMREALSSLGPGYSPYFRERLTEGEARFRGRITASRRFDLDAVLSAREAREGITIPFRFHLGPRLIAEDIAIPAGVQRGQVLEYTMRVAKEIRLDIVVHIDLE